jgi:hypothetical protein
MKKFWNNLINFFQENGLIKLFSAILLLCGLIALYRHWPNCWLKVAMVFPASYIAIEFIIQFSYGIIGMIRDIFKKK